MCTKNYNLSELVDEGLLLGLKTNRCDTVIRGKDSFLFFSTRDCYRIRRVGIVSE